MPKIVYQNNQPPLEVDSGIFLSDALEENGVRISLACRSGACGTCVFRVLAPKNCAANGAGWPLPSDEEGETLKLIQADPDQRLACQWVVDGDLEIEIPN